MNHSLYKRAISGFKDFQSHFGLLFAIFIPVFILINITYIYISQQQVNTILNAQAYEAQEEISIVDFVIRNDILNTHNDLLVIRDSVEFNDYINNPSPTTLASTEQLFRRIAVNKPMFHNIRFLDTDGMEVIKVENLENGPVIFSSENLVDKSDTYYYLDSVELSNDELYMSNIDVQNDIPVVRFIIPSYDQSSQLKGYLVINYFISNIISVFNEYVGNSNQYIELGLLSKDMLYQFSLNEITDENIITIIEGSASDNENYILQPVTISSSLADIFQTDDDSMTIFAFLDKETLLTDSGNILTDNYLLLIIIDIIVITVFTYIGFVLKSRNDDRVLLNANVYLSDTNKDGVLITDANKKISYINKTFEHMFKYQIEDIKGFSPRQFLKTKTTSDFDVYDHTDDLFEIVLWNKSKLDIYILNYIRINTIKSLKGNIKYFIAIYSKPAFSNQSILEKIPSDNQSNSYSTMIQKISEIFYLRTITVNATLMFLIKVDFTSNSLEENDDYEYDLDIGEYLQANLDKSYFITIPTKNYIILSLKADLVKKNVSYYHTVITHLIEAYKLKHIQDGALSYIITSDFVKEKNQSYEGLIFNLFAAMEFSKKAVTRKHLPYQETMRKTLRRDHLIRNQLDVGFENDEFFLNYQVQESLVDQSITGAEALLRWNNVTLGSIPPSDFIPLIEESYLINSLSLMVVNKVIEDFEPYFEEIPEKFRISVNLTSYDFHNESLIKEIVRVISLSQLETKHFCFEITESGYLENTEKTNCIIDFLHSKDILVAIDDFGKGFSSLSSLKDINIDTVKVDRAFIKDYPLYDDGLMHRTIANLINTLGLKIVIEGTETVEQIALAKSTHCDEHQGYYVSKPLTFMDFYQKFIKNN